MNMNHYMEGCSQAMKGFFSERVDLGVKCGVRIVLTEMFHRQLKCRLLEVLCLGSHAIVFSICVLQTAAL